MKYVVAYGRLKTIREISKKKKEKLREVVAYERFERILLLQSGNLLFWKSGGRIQEVVAYERWSQLKGGSAVFVLSFFVTYS